MNLADYRKQLDRIDAEILQLFEERMNVVREIGIWKKQNGIPVLDAGREAEKLETLKSLLANSQTGVKGIEELVFVLDRVAALNLKSTVELDVSLARGLNYYTGTILEVKALDVEMGSISGGGRYDNLTGVFGMDGLSGVGISFGADRIFDVLNSLDLYPADTIATTKVIFINFGEKEAQTCLSHMAQLRAAGISCELFPESAKMKKQMNYANAKGIPFVAMVGESEMESGTIAVKDMTTGEQKSYTLQEVIDLLK